MHIALPTGKTDMLMGNDVPESMGKTNENENRSKIVIIAESKEEADKLFKGLSAGRQIEGPIGDSPWGSYFGCFRDKYGIEWIVEFDPKYNEETETKNNGRLTSPGLAKAGLIKVMEQLYFYLLSDAPASVCTSRYHKVLRTFFLRTASFDSGSFPRFV